MKQCPKCGENMFAYAVGEEGVVRSVPHKCSFAPETKPQLAGQDSGSSFVWARSGRAKKAAKLTKCPHCGTSVKESNLVGHLYKCPKRPELMAPDSFRLNGPTPKQQQVRVFTTSRRV